MLLRFWALVYRLTGYYSNYAKIKEYEHLSGIFRKLEDYKSKDPTISLKNIISIQIGLWQAHNGFYRKWGYIKPRKRKFK